MSKKQKKSKSRYQVKNLRTIPAGDWIIHAVYARRDKHGSIQFEYTQHTVVGWGTDEIGYTQPFYWSGYTVASIGEIEWYGYDVHGSPRGADWSVLPRGEYPDVESLREFAKDHLERVEHDVKKSQEATRA